jgi:putative effector of murein hydrolase
MSPSRSLSFPSRSLTLALATPATQNLGGDLGLVAVLCILSGILGVLIGPQLLDLLGIPQGKPLVPVLNN